MHARGNIKWLYVIIGFSLVFVAAMILKVSYSKNSSVAGVKSGEIFGFVDLVPSHARKGTAYVEVFGRRFDRVRGYAPFYLIVKHQGRDFAVFVQDSSDGSRLWVVDMFEKRIAMSNYRLFGFGNCIGGGVVGMQSDRAEMIAPDQILLHEAYYGEDESVKVKLEWKPFSKLTKDRGVAP